MMPLILNRKCETGHSQRILGLVSAISLKGLELNIIISKVFIPFAGHDAINLEQEMRNGSLMKTLKTKDSESGYNLFFKGSGTKDVNWQRFHSPRWP